MSFLRKVNSNLSTAEDKQSEGKEFSEENSYNQLTIQHRAVKGGIWMFGSTLLGYGSFALTFWVLARLIAPDDYGLIGILSTYTIIIFQLSELGLGAAIIQKADLNPIHISTVFWSNLVLGIALCVISISAAPLVGNFFHSNILISAFSLTSITIILYSLSVVQRSLLSRSLTFKKIAIAEGLSSGSFLLVTSTLAFFGTGIQSFVIGLLVRGLIFSSMLWKLNSWRPKFVWNYSAFLEMARFGKWVVTTSITNQLYVNIDYLFVGRFLGPSILGYYTLAYQLMSYPRLAILPILTRIAFPVLSLLQKDDISFLRMYSRMIYLISLFMFPLFSLLIVVTPDFIMGVFGAKWIPSILPLQILCISGIAYSLTGPTIMVCQAKGRSDLGAKQFIIRTIILPICLFIGVRYGMVGVAITVSVFASLSTIFFQRWVNNLIGINFTDFAKLILPAMQGSLVIIFSAFSIQFIMHNIIKILPFFSFIMTSLVAGLSYCLYMWIFHRKAMISIFNLLLSILPNSRATRPVG
jgi:O-antigen/teichoic acid export membrane protein